MKARSTPNAGTAQVANGRYSAAYSSGVKLPPHPQDSFPMPQYRTPNGSRSPPEARCSASVVPPAGELQYSNHSENERAGRARKVTARKGCAATRGQNRINSIGQTRLGTDLGGTSPSALR